MHLIGKRDIFFLTPTGDYPVPGSPGSTSVCPHTPRSTFLWGPVYSHDLVGQEMLWGALSHACREARRGEGEMAQAGET